MTCKIFLSSSEDKKALDFNGCSDKVKTHLSVASSIFKGPNDECYLCFPLWLHAHSPTVGMWMCQTNVLGGKKVI